MDHCISKHKQLQNRCQVNWFIYSPCQQLCTQDLDGRLIYNCTFHAYAKILQKTKCNNIPKPDYLIIFCILSFSFTKKCLHILCNFHLYIFSILKAWPSKICWYQTWLFRNIRFVGNVIINIHLFVIVYL